MIAKSSMIHQQSPINRAAGESDAPARPFPMPSPAARGRRITRPDPSRPVRKAALDSWAFVLLLITTGILFIRPAEIIPSLDIPHLYEILILGTLFCFVSTLHRASATWRILTSPIGVCVLAMLPAALLSNLVHGRTWEARFDTLEFSKRIVFFILIIGIVNTPARLKTFMKCLTVYICVLTGLGLLQYHHFINIEALQQFQEHAVDDIDVDTGLPKFLTRLCGAGIFNDPNDLCLILMLGVMSSLYWFRDAERRYRPLWLLPVAMFVYSIYQTHSRGGFMAMLSGIGVLLFSRVGWKKSVIIYAVILPVILVAFSGRQTEISTEDETANQRIQLWSQGLQFFKSSPVFGIGMNRFDQEAGLVAHNSFVHCYAELGFVGGTLFLGAFIYCLWAIARLQWFRPHQLSPAVERFRPYLLGALTAYAIGYMTLSRAYVEPTYLMFALAAVYLDFAAAYWPAVVPRLRYRMVAWAIVFGLMFIGAEYLFVRLFAHWSA